MVITSCSSVGACDLSIAYNQQIPLCTGAQSESGACRDPEALCVADKDFSFNLELKESNSAFTTIPVSALLPHSSLVFESTSFRGEYPTPPSIGDYNIDGYPDLLLLTSTGSQRRVSILQSRPCDATSCTKEEVKSARRAFRVVKEGAEVLSKIHDAESAHWVDVDDDVSVAALEA